MNQFFITVATVCIQTLITHGKGVDSQDTCVQAAKISTVAATAKPGETVYNAVTKEWLEAEIKLIDAAQEALKKTTDYYFAEADRTYCDRNKHIWFPADIIAIKQSCAMCKRKRQKVKKEEWIIEP